MSDSGYREPRFSSDREDAPLLRDPDENSYDGETPRTRRTFSQVVNDIVQEPLTTLTNILLVLVLLLLLLTAVFIGLFAGAEHRLTHDREWRNAPTTTTVYHSTSVIGPTSTATMTTTTTVPGPPLPEPTKVPGTDPNENLCTTPECIILSASILQNIDLSQDPCEDFYEFSNGGWFSKNEIPPGKGLYGSFDVVSQENKRIIRRILDTDSGNAVKVSDSYDDLTLTRLRNLYSSCMNEDLLNERGISPLLDIVSTVRDLYRSDIWKKSDTMEAETASNYGLTAAISFLHSRGIGGLFDIDIDGDVGVDPNLMTLWFSQPELGLPSKEYYEEVPIVELYEKTLARFLLALDDTSDEENFDPKTAAAAIHTEEDEKVWPPWPWPPWGDDDNGEEHKKPLNKTERAKQLAKNVVKFEKKIAKASLDLEVLHGNPFATYNPVEFHVLDGQLPQIDFPTYLSTFTPRNFPERVILTSTTYAASLSSILSSTDSETVEAYLVTRIALAYASLLSHDTEVWQAYRELIGTLQGIKKGQEPDRSEWCIQKVEDNLGFAAGRFFVQEAFGGDSKDKGTKVITDIISTFKESLKNLHWMDEESAKAAAQKADAIRVKVGYPLSPDTESSRSIASYYRLVLVDKAEFFESIVSAQISEVFKKWQTLGKQRDLQAWLMYPSMVNAYFNPPANEIVFPAGILQPPFFNAKWPAYVQYGAFGAVAAHELTHAFDSAGRLYNQQGKLEQWWTNATSEGFNGIQKCIAEQYSNYYIDDGKGGKLHVNGNLTSGENIGDSGLVQAYRAWRGQFHTEGGKYLEPLLPGLNYTQEQLFFIGFGQIWAQLIKPAAAVQRIRTDPHSPNKFRVEGTLANIPEFAAAFQCKEGTKMNPPKEQRCVLW